MEKQPHMIRDSVSEQIIGSAAKLAKQRSAGSITVRDILKDLGITNRVFYNRFHNIEEVLEILYREMVEKVRESLSLPWKEDTDFFAHVNQVATGTLVRSYLHKENLSQFVFENDSRHSDNLDWWCNEIKKLICLGIERGFVRKGLDLDALSYSVWCFIRGFNADAIARRLSLEEAQQRFSYGFGIFLSSVRA